MNSTYFTKDIIVKDLIEFKKNILNTLIGVEDGRFLWE